MTKILVVDDEPVNIELISALLPEEYAVSSALDGKEALIKGNEMPDLILLDIMMPEMDGYEVCRCLKSDEKTMFIPIVMVTSLTGRDDRIKAIEAGADDFLNKPVDAVELNARVKSLLRIKKYHDELLENQEKLRDFNLYLEKKVQEKTAFLAAEVEMRKKAEIDLHNTLWELARSKAELERMINITSREMEKPLHVVASNLGRLGDTYKGKFLDNNAWEMIGNAVDGTFGIQKRINDLNAYSQAAVSKELADAGTILESVLSDLGAVVKKTGAEILHDKLPEVLCDRMQLRQLFHNLLYNAINYSGAMPPKVHISAAQQGEYWVFTVQDNRNGIDPKYLDSMFHILKATVEAPAETDIGLAVCKKIVESLGGKIWLESEKGLKFNFTIPKK